MDRLIDNSASRPVSIIGVALLFMLLQAKAFATATHPDVSAEGLQLLEGSKVKVVYIKPDTSFTQYRKVKLLDCYVDFKEGWQRNYNLREVHLTGRIEDQDVEKIKSDLALRFRTIFSEALVGSGYSLVDEIGPDVLLLRPAMLNVDINAPAVPSGVNSKSFVRSAGNMTLFLELYDSSTSTLLARFIDQRADRDNYVKLATQVTNTSAVDRILSYWADLMSQTLAELQADDGG